MSLEGLNGYAPSPKRPGFINDDGVHRVVINDARHFVSRDGEWRFVVNFTVVKSTDLPPGSTRAYMITQQAKYPDLWRRDVARFLSAACEAQGQKYDPDNGEDVARAVFYENSIEGLTLALETKNKETKKGNTFTEYIWSAPEDDDELDF